MQRSLLVSFVLTTLGACGDPWTGTRTLPADDTGLDSHAPDDSAGTGDTDEPPTDHPARYRPGELQSPITPWVQRGLHELAAAGSGLDSQVFMKVGDSITVDGNALHCFAGSAVELGARDDLQPSLDHFLAGTAAGSTPFDRDSEAAAVGMSATWAISGDPSPMDQELDALNPAFAVVQYGTNDMHLGTTSLSAIYGFGSNLLDLIDALLGRGVVPVLITIPPRLDSADADAWVPTYNAVIRGIAQGRQIPLVDLEAGLRAVDGYGLSGDGVHLDAFYDGGYRACDLGAEGLEHGNNTRNLLILDALDRVRRAVLHGEVLDEAGPAQQGEGTAGEPFEISLPATDLRDTQDGFSSSIDVYDGCGASQDESGPEVVYRFEISERATIRAIVFDRGDVDIDLHLLGDGVSGADCLLRDDSNIETTLSPGTYHLVLDSYVSSGEVLSGEYLLVLQTLED